MQGKRCCRNISVLRVCVIGDRIINYTTGKIHPKNSLFHDMFLFYLFHADSLKTRLLSAALVHPYRSPRAVEISRRRRHELCVVAIIRETFARKSNIPWTDHLVCRDDSENAYVLGSHDRLAHSVYLYFFFSSITSFGLQYFKFSRSRYSYEIL